MFMGGKQKEAHSPEEEAKRQEGSRLLNMRFADIDEPDTLVKKVALGVLGQDEDADLPMDRARSFLDVHKVLEAINIYREMYLRTANEALHTELLRRIPQTAAGVRHPEFDLRAHTERIMRDYKARLLTMSFADVADLKTFYEKIWVTPLLSSEDVRGRVDLTKIRTQDSGAVVEAVRAYEQSVGRGDLLQEQARYLRAITQSGQGLHNQAEDVRFQAKRLVKKKMMMKSSTGFTKDTMPRR